MNLCSDIIVGAFIGAITNRSKNVGVPYGFPYGSIVKRESTFFEGFEYFTEHREELACRVYTNTA